ncbi:MAG: flagellar biosynthetic protein FliO [candidate division Zixibacteria bacterium]|nr:flagellar biosynthetic protein FliO [candidate division Zixibacteria bacterium]
MNKLLVVLTSGNLVAETEKIPDTGTGSLIIRLFLSLVLIIGLIYLSLFLLKKSSLGLKKNRAGDLIQVLERCYISPKKGIFIVKIGSKLLALGVTENQISLLSELDSNPESNTDLKDKVVSEKEIRATFLQKIKGKLNL